MSILSIDLSHGSLFKVLLVDWVLFVAECFCVAGGLDMVVTWENLCERVLHFHFPIKSSGHVPFWAKWTILLHKSSCWWLLIVVSVIWELGFPVVLQSQKSVGFLIHTPLLAEVMHNILVLTTAVRQVVDILGNEGTWSILNVASEDHLGRSKLTLIPSVPNTRLIEIRVDRVGKIS